MHNLNFKVGDKVMVFQTLTVFRPDGGYIKDAEVTRTTKTTVEVDGVLYNVDGTLRGRSNFSSARIERFDAAKAEQLTAAREHKEKAFEVRRFMEQARFTHFTDAELETLQQFIAAYNKRVADERKAKFEGSFERDPA